MSDEILAAVIALVGVGIGGLIGGLANWFLDNARRDRELNGAARAIAGEINAVLSVMRHRRYLEGIQSCIDAANDSGNIIQLTVRIKEEYFALTKMNLQHVGALKGALPNLIPQLMTYASAGMEDIHRMYEDDRFMDDFTPEQASAHYTELHAVFFEFMRIGELIVQEVDAFYKEP